MLIYNIQSEDRFVKNYFLIVQTLLPSIGALSLRYAVLKGQLSVFNIAFWASLIATVNAFFYYSFQYWQNATPPFFHITYQLNLLNVATIWIFRIIIDTFNVLTFIYLASKRKIAKAAVAVTLNAFFVIAFNMIMGTYPPWIYPYVALIYGGYTLIAYDRKKVFEARMRKLIKVKFVSKVNTEHEEFQTRDFTFNPEITNKELMLSVSTYQYIQFLYLLLLFEILIPLKLLQY